MKKMNSAINNLQYWFFILVHQLFTWGHFWYGKHINHNFLHSSKTRMASSIKGQRARSKRHFFEKKWNNLYGYDIFQQASEI